MIAPAIGLVEASQVAREEGTQDRSDPIGIGDVIPMVGKQRLYDVSGVLTLWIGEPGGGDLHGEPLVHGQHVVGKSLGKLV